jgi:hypothetical protein
MSGRANSAIAPDCEPTPEISWLSYESLFPWCLQQRLWAQDAHPEFVPRSDIDLHSMRLVFRLGRCDLMNSCVSEDQAAGSMNFCAEGGSTGKTRT